MDMSSGTCTGIPVNPAPCAFAFSTALFKDTLYFTTGNGELYEYVMGAGSACHQIYSGANSEVLNVDTTGNIWWIDENSNELTVFNPHTGIAHALGRLNYYPSGDLLFYNQLLIMSSAGALINVNMANPGQSTVYMETPQYGFWGLANVSTSCSQHIIYGFQSSTNNSTAVVAIDMLARSIIGTYCTLPFEVFDAASSGEDGGGGMIPVDIFPVGDTVSCIGRPLSLDAGNPGSTYLWDNGSTARNRTVNTDGTYWVTVTNLAGCSALDSIVCQFVDGPILHLPADTTICEGRTLVLNAGFPQTTYTWQDGSTEPTYTVSQAGRYTVTATDECGTSSQSAQVAFQACGCEFVVPSAFTPNNDGNNDVFRPIYIDRCGYAAFPGYQMNVFNRWGELVFHSENPSEGWNGSFKGKLQPSGVYVWELNYIDQYGNKPIRKNGTVVMIR
jgi:gliding motility-associated-like protein